MSVGKIQIKSTVDIQSRNIHFQKKINFLTLDIYKICNNLSLLTVSIISYIKITYIGSHSIAIDDA